MAKITEEPGRTIIKLEQEGAYNTLQRGLAKRTEWNRHPETRVVAEYLAKNTQSNVIVQVGDVNVKVR